MDSKSCQILNGMLKAFRANTRKGPKARAKSVSRQSECQLLNEEIN